MEQLALTVANLRLPVEGEEADWLGIVDRMIRDLQAKRRIVLDELEGPVEGEGYRVVVSRAAKRSYNTAGILAAFGEVGWDMRDLIGVDACRLSWRWSELKRAAVEANVGLRIAHSEVDDDGDVEAPMVGEVWSDRLEVKGK